MTDWTLPDAGTLRITNPGTLQQWKDTGKYQKLIDEGYIYAEGCGRFKTEPCTCHKCRKLVEKLKRFQIQSQKIFFKKDLKFPDIDGYFRD